MVTSQYPNKGYITLLKKRVEDVYTPKLISTAYFIDLCFEERIVTLGLENSELIKNIENGSMSVNKQYKLEDFSLKDATDLIAGKHYNSRVNEWIAKNMAPEKTFCNPTHPHRAEKKVVPLIYINSL